ncbi:ATP-dependent nuclease subunit B, partial [Lacticaseibacillus rhamnosus]
MTRSQSQGPTCKDLDRNGQSPAITPKATYTPIAKRSCSRSAHHNAFAGAEV